LLEDEALLEDDVATREISSSRSADALLTVTDRADESEAAAVEVAWGAVAANHAPRPRKEAALTAPVMRRAPRAGCGFVRFCMTRACTRRRKST